MNKFKIGDIIKGTPESDDRYSVTNSNTKMKVIQIYDSKNIRVKLIEPTRSCEIGEEFEVESKYFKLFDFKFDEIKPGDIITLRNGDRLYVDKDYDLIDLEGYNNHCTNLNNSFDNFISIDFVGDEDIIKVERPTYYEIIYEESPKIKEMTLKEICEELGYEIKIVKEKEGNK